MDKQRQQQEFVYKVIGHHPETSPKTLRSKRKWDRNRPRQYCTKQVLGETR